MWGFGRSAALENAHLWGGLIDLTPDALPMIDRAGPDGLVIGAGFSGHGFGIGPGAGHLIADVVTGATPINRAFDTAGVSFTPATVGDTCELLVRADTGTVELVAFELTQDGEACEEGP